MIAKLFLSGLLPVMVLAAACGGGEASTVDETDPAETLSHFEAGVALEGKGQLEEAMPALLGKAGTHIFPDQ